MSKSKGNVINPDEVINKFGADTLRVYEMFMAPLEADKPWDTRAVSGVYRFLNRVYNLVNQADAQAGGLVSAVESRRVLHRTLKKVSEDIPKLKYNTAIAAMMELVNAWEAAPSYTQEELEVFVKMIAPFAPFMAEELWQTKLGQTESVHLSTWPTWDETIVAQENVTIPVQVNGKVRAQLVISTAEAQDKTQVYQKAKALPNVQTWLKDRQVQKEIYIPSKIVNFVVN